MLRPIRSFSLCAIALSVCSTGALAQTNLTAKAGSAQPVPKVVEDSDRLRDGLVGPVRRVRTEVAKLSSESGKLVESKHAVLEVVSYDIKGNKLENQYFPIAGSSLTGKEVYKYDEKGNISEMTLLNTDGSLMSKEVYKYEFDFAGNWSKMTTSVAVIEGGKLSFEPSEVTYRSIMYYLDENMLKMSQPASQPAATPSSSPNVASNTAANNPAPLNLQPKSVEVSKTVGDNSSANRKNSAALPNATSNVADKTSGATELAKPTAAAQTPVVNVDSDPPPVAPRPILKPVSGGVLNGTALTLPSPMYPETARRMRVSGVVVVEVVVDETGKVISAVATSGPATLRDVAVQAALRAKFSPTKLSGQPVKVTGIINYKFALAQ
ncbi:MAG TPA: TonB family protein [Pyrinomonadaceae bacterium]|nr:TonB family protein [Pyrinomonadaceae bacterium]